MSVRLLGDIIYSAWSKVCVQLLGYFSTLHGRKCVRLLGVILSTLHGPKCVRLLGDIFASCLFASLWTGSRLHIICICGVTMKKEVSNTLSMSISYGYKLFT